MSDHKIAHWFWKRAHQCFFSRCFYLSILSHTSNDWLRPASFSLNVLAWLLSFSHTLFLFHNSSGTLYLFIFHCLFSQNLSKVLSFFHQLCYCESFHTIIRPTIPLLLFIHLLWPCTSSACQSSISCYTITAAHTISPSLLPKKYGHMVSLTGFWSKWLYLVTILPSFSIPGASKTGLENCE